MLGEADPKNFSTSGGETWTRLYDKTEKLCNSKMWFEDANFDLREMDKHVKSLPRNAVVVIGPLSIVTTDSTSEFRFAAAIKWLLDFAEHWEGAIVVLASLESAEA